MSGGNSDTSDHIQINKTESNSGHHQKKTTNLTSWLQSDYSIFDSQPQTAKVKRETDANNDTSKERALDQFRAKRISISEKNILAALKSPINIENKRSVTNLAISQAQLACTGGKLQMPAFLGNQIGGGAKKKEKKREKEKTKKSTGVVIAGTFDDRGKKSVQNQGKETDRDTAKPGKRHKSRDGSLKFLTDRTQNVFGEKFSMIVSNALNNQGHSHRRPVNQILMRREKSSSKERRKEF